MILCSHCKKNVAVIFVTKIENGKTTNEGLCLKCAKELGVDISKTLEGMGLNPEDMDNLEEQIESLMEMPEDFDPEDIDMGGEGASPFESFSRKKTRRSYAV